jgi:cellulose synthase/poly-beta-1,6-N-acetylglucosamine synthase-like glycosyltransferase
LGYSLKYIPDAIVHHDHPATVKGLFSQQYRNGIGFVRLHRKYGQRYNLAYNTGIYWGSILFILLRYPFTLISAVVGKKKKYFVLEPLYYVICNSAFSWGIVRETLWGKEYRGYPLQSRIDFMEFMEDKPVSSLWQKIVEKVREYS